MSPCTPILFSERGLGACADRLTVRDPRGRSARPSVVRADGGLRLEGPVTLRLEYAVDKDAAIRFVDATGDDNRIHREENIVPGAYTACKVVSLLEVLAPDLALQDVKSKFTAPTFYGGRAVAIIRIAPGAGDAVAIEAETTFRGEPAAKTEISARTIPFAQRAVPIKERKVNGEHLALVRSYLASLGFDPEAYFAKRPERDYTYPIGFLAALPSGEMVRHFSGGQGGVLNALSLSFGDSPRLPITTASLPTVALETGKARASLFARIAARIIEGLTTYGRGFALVAQGLSLPGVTAPRAE